MPKKIVQFFQSVKSITAPSSVVKKTHHPYEIPEQYYEEYLQGREQYVCELKLKLSKSKIPLYGGQILPRNTPSAYKNHAKVLSVLNWRISVDFDSR
jgi:hypothetical protein